MKTLFLALLLAIAALLPSRANADQARTAFALIVTSNHGASGARPDLHYADDDGVKYLELFRALAPEANVILHTELDRDTERLYPWAHDVARAPTRAAVTASIADIAQRVAAVRRAGGAADFYFAFAGHGDVDAGMGFLELRDARFTADDLETMLKSIDATRSHVILDSCNSFFVVQARKPGGKAIATTADEARSISERLPNVGVFLSTSAEAEVFEWSELQAGIFSHAVRSGLTGAADANGDGNVSYEELRTFVSVASARIRNPQYRPKVFARAPSANAREPLVRLGAMHGSSLRIDGPRIRLTLRDADDVPMVDLHKEEGASLTLHLPARWATHAFAEAHDANDPSIVRTRLSLDAHDTSVALASLTPSEAPMASRGAGEMFRMLFVVPFGPRAMAGAVPEVRKEDANAVYGVSEDEVQRMRTLLEQAAGDENGRRITAGTAQLSVGALFAAGSVALFTTHDTAKTPYPYFAAGYSAVFLGEGLWTLLSTPDETRAYERYMHDLESADPEDRAAALMHAEQNLFALRHNLQLRRKAIRVSSIILLAAGIGGLALTEIPTTTDPTGDHGSVWPARVLFGSFLGLGATALVSSFVPYPVERLANMWESDPGRVRANPMLPNVAFAPSRGGGQLQLGWSF